MVNNSEELKTIETTARLLKSSLMSQNSTRLNSKWSSKPRQQDFSSMDDIKPTTKTILKRPTPVVTHNSIGTRRQSQNTPPVKTTSVTSPIPDSNNNNNWAADTNNNNWASDSNNNNWTADSNNNEWSDVTSWDNTTDKSSNYSTKHEISPRIADRTPPRSRPRTRDQTIDSVSHVKIAPFITRFEDIKSEAMNSWEEGVDLRLEMRPPTKKKPTEWLKDSEFVSNNSITSPVTNNISPAWLQTTSSKKTYVEAAENRIQDRKTPEWALEDGGGRAIQPQAMEMPYGYQQQQPWAPNSHNMQHMMMMPSPYMQIQPTMYPTSRDNEYFQYFYKVVRDCNIPNTIVAFQKKVEKILRYLPEFSPRTFAKLLEALVPVLKYEISQKQLQTAQCIREAWQFFVYYLTRHLQAYANTPEDLVSAVTVCSSLIYHTPKIYKELPMADIMRLFESVKDMFTADLNKECLKHLRLLKAIPDTKETSWRDMDERLPSIPSAETIVEDAINKVNVLIDYEAKKEIYIANKAHNPWPNVDLLNYSLVHFMMLREELIRPIQNTIHEYFTGKPAHDFEMPFGCAVFEGTKPKATTLLVSSSEVAVVFSLGTPLLHDEIIDSFQEGSFVIILPESQSPFNLSDRHNEMMLVAKGSMMGHAIRAATSKSRRLVSIHINKDDIGRMDWSSTYTLVTCRTNATSTLSVLSWLHKEYVGLKKERFSAVLTPRILAANNILSDSQLTAWDAENTESALATNQDAVPDYLTGVEVDVSCLMANRGYYKARPGENSWPRHASEWENVSPSKRPALYNISPSQLTAIKFAMSHRIAVISGAPGTGKTFIASKLAIMMSGALNAGQFHQPVLIISKSQSSLDDILKNVLRSVPDVIRFGGEPWDATLLTKQATKLVEPIVVSDANHRHHQHWERQLCKNQMKLNALFIARFQAFEHDPAVLSTAISPQYLKCLQEGYMKNQRQTYTPNDLAIWKLWAALDDKTNNYPAAQAQSRELDLAQFALESAYLKKTGRGLMPIVDTTYIQKRFGFIGNSPMHVLPIVESTKWPFEDSSRSSHDLRAELIQVWKRIPLEKVWAASKEERTAIIDALANVLIHYIDQEIHDIIQDQNKVAKSFDESLIQKWVYLCRFNRVIGLTADFAATHRDLISNLWPRAVIVDEASEILESTLVSTILGPRTEHVVLLGNNDSLAKPPLINAGLTGNPRNLDVSLFERWKRSGSEMVLLEEQWRMHTEVASIVNQFNSIKDDNADLLITAPLASCNENMVDGSKPQAEKLYGITQRAFYLKYQQSADSRRSAAYSLSLATDLTEAEVDEARFVAFFAVYLSQQPYPKANITILTTNFLQKFLVRAILRDEAPKRTCFKSNISKISIDTIEQNVGREDDFTIISTATPGYSFSTFDNVSNALTRSKYGIFVIGKPEVDDVHQRWKDFAAYMESRDLAGPHIQLTCHAHGDTFSVSKWQDFDQVRNGGCSMPCNTLMSDGHVCQETCHFLSHEEIICKEPCNRPRPSRCDHVCKQKCFECSKNGTCAPCKEETTVMMRCGHPLTGICHTLQNLDDVDCKALVRVVLPCGHEIETECHNTKFIRKIKCNVRSTVWLDCGHEVIAQCGVPTACTEVCDQFYECGHPCKEMCGIEHSHDRNKCDATCPKQLICGHGCDNGCANPDRHTERCIEKCNYVCSHEYKCSRECWRDCIKCVSACPYKCDHYKCSKKCYEICDRPPCNHACKLRLDCSHACPGLCGEPCPPCSICFSELKCSISLRTLSEFDHGEKVYALPECGCVFSVESLDMYFLNQAKNGDHTAIKLWGCPTCQKTIYRAFRYQKYIKTEIGLVNAIKTQIEKERQKLTFNEKTQIINAMNDETKHGIHNMVGGRWFVCPNQHPYFVGDCGGATQISKCPECDAPIGGTQHRVVESNRFYGEFDGSNAPAWPGQPDRP
ncbi:uncharacterized protein EV154DRAFT_496731 [Mucor mucedo]|uniref:uncharacterized protein n=1 Tax=Mucor mucedo TaxID=29922 RepID=UPI00221F6189|nr:uncharacterized protein EV154DRAFT_496731 [Mucor mucedo]KAI7895019.1 hypothetical protein EV154DRAFT_496731 [Mucor mucedo]